MNHVWSILCEKVVIDQESKNMSLFNVLEQLNLSAPIEKLAQAATSKKLKAIPINLELVTLWSRDEAGEQKDIQTKITFVDPNEKNLGSTERTFVIREGHKRMRNRTKIEGFPVTVPGTYHVELSHKPAGNKRYKKVASVPLEITFRQSEASE